MAEFHNTRDLQIIQILQDEHNQVREQLRRLPQFYNPTESHADIIRDVIDTTKEIVRLAEQGLAVRNTLRQEIISLKARIRALKMEKISAKIDIDTHCDPFGKYDSNGQPW